MPAVAEIVRRLWERQRAGTRPAPTFRCLEGRGQARGLPLPSDVWNAEGRHKACPYRCVRGEGRHKACPYRCVRGEGRHKACPYRSWSGRRCNMFGGREFEVYSVADREREGL